MRISVGGPVRAVLLLGAVYSMVAVGLGRTAPKPTEFHLLSAGRWFGINEYHLTQKDHHSLLLDSTTGACSRLELPDGDRLDYAVTAPWQDEEGGRQLVGRWRRRSPERGLALGFGLARYAYPSGQILDRISLDVMPMGFPCFLPGRHARVLFAAGDGVLYRVDFPDAHDGQGPGSDEASRAVAVRWRSDLAGAAPSTITDPTWPMTPRFGGRLIAVLTRFVDVGCGTTEIRSELAWLRLDAECREIVAAGPLCPDDPTLGMGSSGESSVPSVGETAEGNLVLAYLVKRAGVATWDLRLAPITIDAASGNPTIDRSGGVMIAEGRSHVMPVLSSDCRWVYSLPRPAVEGGATERSLVPAGLRPARGSGRHIASRPPRHRAHPRAGVGESPLRPGT